VRSGQYHELVQLHAAQGETTSSTYVLQDDLVVAYTLGVKV